MEETRLANGARVLTERIPGVRSVAVGAWIRQGASHEDPPLMGASHLLEHLVFKGTEKRTAREIALALEEFGGALDAYTSRENTSFQARVLDEHLPVALEILSDLIRHPLLRDEDLAMEREVVLEEIATVDDTPEDLVFDLFGARLWGDHPYGHNILGTRETVGGMPGEALRQIHRTRYGGGNLVVAAAGNVEHGDVLRQVEGLFGELEAGRSNSPVPPPGREGSGEERIRRDSAQSHLILGGATPGHSDDRRFPLVILSSALGGGMSSRLFQRIREELALAYAVYTFQSFYSRGGVFGVYLGTRPAAARRAAKALREELGRVAREGLESHEVEQTKQQLKGQVMLSLESTASRLYRLASFALHDEPFLTLDELLKKLDAVTPDAVASVASEFLDPERLLLLQLGPEA